MKQTSAPKSYKPEQPGSQCPEFNIWETDAEEDVSHGLKRLATLARDLHQQDSSKSVGEYYSERLIALIQETGIEFDCSGLHEVSAQ